MALEIWSYIEDDRPGNDMNPGGRPDSGGGGGGRDDGNYALDFGNMNPEGLTVEEAQQAVTEGSKFEWSWEAIFFGVVPGLVINGIRAITHYIALHPGTSKTDALDAVKAENPEFADLEPSDMFSEGGNDWAPDIQDAINSSDAPPDVKENLLSGKAIRKAGQNQLWDELQNPSDYDTAIEGMGLRSADRWNTLMTQMESGEFELPAWMQNISDENFGRFTEASSRKGQLPGSTAYGQGTAAFNLADQQSASNYGLGMLGMSYDQALGPYNSMNANRTNQYNTLFGGGSGLLDPQKQKTNEPSKWETMLQIGGDALTGYAYGKAGGLW